MQRNGISLLLILLKRTLAKWRSISGNRVQCKGLKTLQDEVANLKRPLYDSLKHNMKNMFGVHEQVLEQARKLFPDVTTSDEALNPLRSALGVTQRDDPGASASNAST